MNQYPPSDYGQPAQPSPAPKRSPLGIILLVLGVLLVAGGLIIGLAGQGGGGKATTRNNNNNAANPTRKPNATALPTRTLLPPVTPTADTFSELYGIWEQVDPSTGSTVRFEFYPDGTVVIDFDGQTTQSTFRFVDGDTLLILADGSGNITQDTSLDYVVNGDLLSLSSGGETEVLVRAGTGGPTQQPSGSIYGGWEQYDAASGDTVRFEFYTDGTFIVNINGSEAQSTFQFVDSNTIVILADPTGFISSDTTLDYSVNGDTLTLSSGSETQVLSRIW